MATLSTIGGTALFAASLALAGQPGSDTPAWRAELRSSGGFTGRGIGGVAVQADGTIALIRFGIVGGQRDWETTCAVRLPEKIQPVADALATSQTETWRDRYLPPGSPDGCCDQLQWDLEVTRTTPGEAPVRTQTAWIGEGKGLPEDLSRLRAALLEAWNAAKPFCTREGSIGPFHRPSR